MNLWIPRNPKELKQHLNDPLFKNAYFLMANTLLSAAIGFFFWTFAARFYSAQDVGLGSALLSAGGLLSMFSILGFDIGLIRYLPEEKNKGEMINTCFTITLLISLLLSIIFLLGLEIWSPALDMLRNNVFFGLVFIFFTMFGSISSLQTSVFIAFREAKYAFVKNFAIAFKIAILPLLVAFGAFGVYLSAGFSSILAFLFGFLFILRLYSSYKPIPVIRKRVVNDILHYSSGNYIANIFAGLPSVVLPIMVINILSAEMNAYFYIAWAISGLLLAIPLATSTSLLAEGSFLPEELGKNAIRALKFIFILLAVAIIGIFLFGKYVLLLFGVEYARNSFEVLLILALGSIPFAFNSLYAATKRVQKEIKPVVYVYGSIAIITLAASYLLMQNLGIIGVGIAWLLANGLICIFIAFEAYFQLFLG